MKKTNYWLIEGEEARAKWDELFEGVAQQRTDARKWVEDKGGTGNYLRSRDEGVCGMEFETNPGKDWKENRRNSGYYSPKRNTKAGKLLSAEMFQLRCGVSREIVSKAFLGYEMIFSKLQMLTCGWEKLSPGVILMATPGEEKEQWKPIEGLRLLKDSEYWKIKEEEAEKMEVK